MTKELTIEESKVYELKRIEQGYDELVFTNDLGIEVESTVLADFLLTVEGIDQIETLVISYSSQFHDLTVVRALPNLRSIDVYGDRVTSLDGLEWFKQGQYIKISTEKNRRRRISSISRAPIKRMNLQYARSEDLDDIGECLSLNFLDLFSIPEIDFSKWRRVPLESLGVIQGKFKEFGNTFELDRLKDLRVLGCRSLERFVGDNSGVAWMVISSCKKLDLRTIQTFYDLETLTVNGNQCEIALSELGELKHLKSLTFLNCNVYVDITDLRSQFSQIEKIYISGMKKDQVRELREANPDVAVQEDN